jgi:DNA replicative helicase MCM subunit Mcm2 (Cdc46/Mcm family)
MDQSYFVDWQKGKVQENPDEVGGWVEGGCRVAGGLL